MKKTLTVITIVLIIAFAFTSCEGGLPEGVVNFMGGMGSNLLSDDKTNATKVQEATKIAAAKPNETFSVGEYTINLDLSNSKINIGGTELDLKGIIPENVTSFIKPDGDIKEMARALDENAGKALKEELAKPVEGAEKEAMEGTVALINAAVEAALSAEDMDSDTADLLNSLKITKDEGQEFTKGDALVLQAITNVVFDSAEILAKPDDIDAAAFMEEKNDDLFALVNILNRSGSNLVDFNGIISGLDK